MKKSLTEISSEIYIEELRTNIQPENNLFPIEIYKYKESSAKFWSRKMEKDIEILRKSGEWSDE